MAEPNNAAAVRTKKHKLQFPFEYQGVPIAEITVRRPKGRDMRFLPKGNATGVEDMYPFYALLTGLDEPAIDEMDASDIVEIQNIVDGFFPKKLAALARAGA